MEEIILKDKELFLYLNNLGSLPFDAFWELVSERFVWIPLYVILCYLLYKNFSLKAFIFILIFVALGTAVSDQVASIFKHGFLRFRPCKDPELQGLFRKVVTPGSDYGFYSAHASNTFFLATYLSVLLKGKLKWFPIAIFVWAAVVSYSRIYLAVHFPGDVLMGAFMGIIIGLIFSFLAKKVIAKQTAQN